MLSQLHKFFCSISRPSKKGTFFLYPGTQLQHNMSVIGFSKNIDRIELYLESGINKEKNFILYSAHHHSSFQKLVSADESEFDDIAWSFASFQPDAIQHDIFVLDHSEYNLFFKKLTTLLELKDNNHILAILEAIQSIDHLRIDQKPNGSDLIAK